MFFSSFFRFNHVHKRMGTALINLSKQKKLGGRGQGRLTKEKAIKFQHYYRHAITHNIGSQDSMRTAIWASLFHCMSTDEEPKHDRCPRGRDSWCFYNRAKPGEPTYHHIQPTSVIH